MGEGRRSTGREILLGSETNDGVTGAELLCSTSLFYLKLPGLFLVFPHHRSLEENPQSALAWIFLAMAQIPTPPASRPGSEAPDVDAKSANEVKASVEEPAATPVDLAQYLDTLLEQYLVLLDQQQKLQSSLAEQLSSV